MVHHGDFEKFLDEKMPILDFINRDKLYYCKINYVSANIDYFDDINKYEQIEQYIQAGHSKQCVKHSS